MAKVQQAARAPVAGRPSLDERWPLAADYPCCVPQCITWNEPDGTPAWEHDHGDRCPTRTSHP